MRCNCTFIGLILPFVFRHNFKSFGNGVKVTHILFFLFRILSLSLRELFSRSLHLHASFPHPPFPSFSFIPSCPFSLYPRHCFYSFLFFCPPPLSLSLTFLYISLSSNRPTFPLCPPFPPSIHVFSLFPSVLSSFPL